MHDKKEGKLNKKQKAIAWISVLLLLTAFGVSTYKIVMAVREYRKSADAYSDLQEYVFPVYENTAPVDTDNGDSDSLDETTESTIGWYTTLQNIGADFTRLAEINSDVVGWISIPSTKLSYPVTQTGDNTYYLNHLFTGETNICGCAFLDCRNDEDFESRNNIVYGHRMNDGSMFTCIQNYKNQSYYDAHPTATLYTPEGTYTIEFFAGYVTEAYGDPWRLSFASDEAYMEWHDSLVARSDFTSNVSFSEADRVITLSTCSGSFTNARYVLHGVIRGY